MKTDAFLLRLFRNWPAKILSLAVALLLLVFHDITRLEERFITVPLVVEQSAELVPASPWPRQVRLRLRGEGEYLFRVLDEDLTAHLDLQRFTTEGDFRVPVEVRRSGSAAEPGTLEITVEPETVVLTLEERMVKSVEVQPRTSGFVPGGFNLVQSVMTPSAVEVEGPRSIIEPLSVIYSEDVDLSTRREDFTERIRLVSPDPLIRFRGGDIVEYRGIVEEAVVLQTFDPVEMVISGLDPDFSLGQTLPPGLIRVQARQIDIEQLEPGDLQLSVEAVSLTEPGTFRVPVRPVVPPGFVVLRYEPTSVQVVIVSSR